MPPITDLANSSTVSPVLANVDMQGATLVDTLHKQTLLLIIVGCIAGLFVIMITIFIVCKVRAYRSQKKALERRGERPVPRSVRSGSIHPIPSEDGGVGKRSSQGRGKRTDGRSLRPNVDRTRKRSFDHTNYSQTGQRTITTTNHASFEENGFYSMKNMGDIHMGHNDNVRNIGKQTTMLYS